MKLARYTPGKRALVGILIALLIGSLGGCVNQENIFSNEEEAFEYLRGELEKRYGEEFVFQEKIHITTILDSDEPKLYTARYAPVKDPSKTFSGSVSPWGGVTDTYGQYFFKEEAEERCTKPLSQFSFIESFTTELDPVSTGRIWKEGDSFESYMGKGSSPFDPFVLVKVYLSDEYTSEEQAGQIKACMDSLYDVGFGVFVQFYTEQYDLRTLYSEKFAAGLDPEFRFGVDEYLGEIKGNKYIMDLERGFITRDDMYKYE